MQIFFLSIFLVSCKEWPKDTIIISSKYYCIREERGFAFTSTVFDYEFYEKRTWWWDKKLGNIVDRDEIAADSIEITNDRQSGVKRIILYKEPKNIFDTCLSFDKQFDISIGSDY